MQKSKVGNTPHYHRICQTEGVGVSLSYWLSSAILKTAEFSYICQKESSNS